VTAPERKIGDVMAVPARLSTRISETIGRRPAPPSRGLAYGEPFELHHTLT